jgi:hypothetical protein
MYTVRRDDACQWDLMHFEFNSDDAITVDRTLR